MDPATASALFLGAVTIAFGVVAAWLSRSGSRR